MSTFQPGQAVTYMRSRSGERQAQDIPATYVGECESWGNGFRPHQIRCVLNGVERNLFVSIYAIRAHVSDEPVSETTGKQA